MILKATYAGMYGENGQKRLNATVIHGSYQTSRDLYRYLWSLFNARLCTKSTVTKCPLPIPTPILTTIVATRASTFAIAAPMRPVCYR